MIDEPERARVVADRETVRLDLSDVDVDLHRARAAAICLDALDQASLCALTELFAGEPLEGLELDWECPVCGHVYTALTQNHELMRYDDRGNGLSDWDVAEISFDAFLKDLEHVVDAAGLGR